MALVGGEDAAIGEALDAAAHQLKGQAADPSRSAIVLSAQHSNEDNFALALVAKRYMGITDVFLASRADGFADDILMKADKNSNRLGAISVAEQLGFDKPNTVSDLVEAMKADRYDYVISLGSAVDVDEDAELKVELSRLKGFVALCSHEGALSKAAHIALPACAWVEAAGTYVNGDGVVQRADAVLESRGDAHPAWQLAPIERIDKTLGTGRKR